MGAKAYNPKQNGGLSMSQKRNTIRKVNHFAIPNVVDTSKPPKWRFGNLLDGHAQRELGEFYEALESSQESQRMIVGYTPSRD